MIELSKRGGHWRALCDGCGARATKASHLAILDFIFTEGWVIRWVENIGRACVLCSHCVKHFDTAISPRYQSVQSTQGAVVRQRVRTK